MRGRKKEGKLEVEFGGVWSCLIAVLDSLGGMEGQQDPIYS